jgi:hypothetical protein
MNGGFRSEIEICYSFSQKTALHSSTQGAISQRSDVVKSMSIMNDATELIIQRVAYNSQSESFAAGLY